MRNFRISNSLWFLLMCICGLCSYRKDDDPANIKQRRITIHQSGIIGRKVIMPDTVEIYSPFKKDSLATNSLPAQVKPFKIYAYVNVSCPTCIVDIENWQAFISEVLNSAVPVIMVCTSKDRFEYFKYLCETKQIKPFTFPLYLDTRHQFATRNPFVNENLAYQTVLTNSGNSILLTGDPIHLENTRKLYLEEIKKWENSTLNNGSVLMYAGNINSHAL